MALKPGAKDCVIKEQIIECIITGLTFQFRSCSDDSAYGCIITVQGDNLPYGNRDMYFMKDGTYDGGCISTAGICPPSWLEEVPS